MGTFCVWPALALARVPAAFAVSLSAALGFLGTDLSGGRFPPLEGLTFRILLLTLLLLTVNCRRHSNYTVRIISRILVT